VQEQGIVAKIADGTAEIELTAKDSCGSCGGCSEGDDGPARLKVEALPGISVGDRVVVETGEFRVTAGAILIFVVPIIGLLAGVFVGQRFPLNSVDKDLSSGIYGFALMIAGFTAAIATDRIFGRRLWQPPRIIGLSDLDEN